MYYTPSFIASLSHAGTRSAETMAEEGSSADHADLTEVPMLRSEAIESTVEDKIQTPETIGKSWGVGETNGDNELVERTTPTLSKNESAESEEFEDLEDLRVNGAIPDSAILDELKACFLDLSDTRSYISMEHLGKAYESVGMEFPPEELELLVETIDRSGKGHICFKDFVHEMYDRCAPLDIFFINETQKLHLAAFNVFYRVLQFFAAPP